MNLIQSIIVIVLLFITPIRATYYMLMTDLGVSAQSIALGNTHGYITSSEAIFSNPASMLNSNDYSFSIFSSKLMNEIEYLQISLSSETDFGSFGAGIYHQKVTDIPATILHYNTLRQLSQVYQLGSYDYKNALYKIAYQAPIFEQYSLGISYNFYSISIDTYRGAGSNFDIGVLIPFKYFNLSIYNQNIIPNRRIHYSNNQSELLPFVTSTTAIIPFYDFTIIPQLTYQKSQLLKSTGFSYTPSFLPFFDILFGYKEQLDYTSDKHQKFTFGFGLTFFTLDIYYAYERSDYFLKDHNTYVSLNYEL
tara:strand:- start:1039 stop:1959 length:921 start_codon:yes stop_codon:yes gene_type:complete